MQDRYGNPLSTGSAKARDAYVAGVDCMLAATDGAEANFEAAIAEDPGFAMAHIALARHHQAWGNRPAVAAPLAAAQACAGLDAREASHLAAFALLMTGKAGEGYKAVRAHLRDYPRDALIAQTCTGVFSLIGFSGLPGREMELLTYTAELAPHYGDDWWFTAQHAFSQMEAGHVDAAALNIETAIAGNPRNANAAHIRAHLYYENGETEAGRKYLDGWMPAYERAGMLHCHLSWHQALWALEQGDIPAMWQAIDANIWPGSTTGPSLNVLTDLASILYRAERRGVEVPQARWAQVSAYAEAAFPKPGIAFADVHAALAHAMAGRSDRVRRVIEGARGPAGDVVRDLAQGFGALAGSDWAEAEAHFFRAMQDHARIGGSRAQRDLVEFAYFCALLRQGRGGEAQRLLQLRRPLATHEGSVVQ